MQESDTQVIGQGFPQKAPSASCTIATPGISQDLQTSVHLIITDSNHSLTRDVMLAASWSLAASLIVILIIWCAAGDYGRIFSFSHDDVFKWKHFPRYWPFVRGILRSTVNSPHKGQWRGALMFSLICAWINGWVNNREAGDLRRHSAHYDVRVMRMCGSGSERKRTPFQPWYRFNSSPLVKMAAISQKIFSNAFSWNLMYELRLKFHWNLFSRPQLILNQCWFR